MARGRDLSRTARRTAGTAVAAALLALAALPAAGDAGEPPPHPLGDRTFDALVLRPLGALGTAVGFAFFVCSTPLAAPTRQLDTAWDTFVSSPGAYTFERELGDF